MNRTRVWACCMACFLALQGASAQQKGVWSLKDCLDYALTNNISIRKSANQIAISKESTKQAKAALLPSLSASTSQSFGYRPWMSGNTSSRDDFAWQRQMKTNFDMMAGVSISIPIYDQRQTKTATNKAKYEWINSKLDLEQSKKDLYNTIENYWLDAASNQQLFKSSIANVNSKQENM